MLRTAVGIFLAMTPLAAHAQAVPPAPASVPFQVPAAGATVRDPSGQVVGTVAAATAEAVILDTGSSQIAFAPTSFTRSGGKVMIGLTKAEIDQAILQVDAKAKANVALLLRPGTPVIDQAGLPVGTVMSVDQDLALVSTPAVKAKVPTRAFVASGQRLMIAMSASQLADAVHKAGTPQP